MTRSVIASHNWYDLTVIGESFEQRFAGRMETGHAAYTDPAIGVTESYRPGYTHLPVD